MSLEPLRNAEHLQQASLVFIIVLGGRQELLCIVFIQLCSRLYFKLGPVARDTLYLITHDYLTIVEARPV